MKKLSTLALCAVTSLFSLGAHAHGSNFRVDIEFESQSIVSAGQQVMSFDLIDNTTKTILGDVDLALWHEKKVHVFVFDAALKEFHHQHPAFDGTRWNVSVDLPVNGEYFVWAQGEIASDQVEFATFGQITVKDGLPANLTPPNLADLRVGSDSISTVTLSNDSLVAGQETMMMLNFTRTDGSTPVITPWLGEKAHIIAVLQDGDSMIHTHTMNTSTPNELMLHVTFPEAGNYRLWIQFMDGGILRTVPLAVQVN